MGSGCSVMYKLLSILGVDAWWCIHVITCVYDAHFHIKSRTDMIVHTRVLVQFVVHFHCRSLCKLCVCVSMTSGKRAVGSCLQSTSPKQSIGEKWTNVCYYSLLLAVYHCLLLPTTIGNDSHKLEPSSYCGEVIESLLLPAMESARGVSAETAQLSFLRLTVNVFLSELRRAITANKKIYR